MLRYLSCLVLKAFKWETEQAVTCPQKCILIGAPHTTNWDFPLTLLALSCMGIRFNWVAKHTLFVWPLGPIFKAIGGIPVDRGSGAAFMMKVLHLFQQRQNIILAIAPEGTRSNTKYWKTGFYTMAQNASVPIAMGYIDYSKKRVGIGETIYPTGNIEDDFEAIRQFYQDKKGKIKENQGEIRIKPPKRRRQTKENVRGEE